MSSEPILSLCMVVKDEEHNLRQCLETVGDAADEVVVVDTGSQDRTREVANDLGARVFSFQWVNDFSAARNFSIDKAQGKYIFWLDADDRLRPNEREKLKALKPWLAENEGKEAFYFRVINENDSGPKGEFIQLRLFPYIPGARFEGRIHEQVYHVLGELGVRLSKLDILIDHMGYDDEEAEREKAQRNLAILLEDLEKEPESPYLHFHIANTYSVLGEHEKSVEHYDCIRALPDLERKYPGALSRVLLEMVSSYHKMDNLQRAEELLLQHNALFEESWLGKFILAELYVEQGRWKEARGLLFAVSDQEPAPDIFPLPLDEVRFKMPWYLGLCHEELGEYEQALRCFEEASKHRPHDLDALTRLGRLSLMLGDVDKSIRCLESVVSQNGGGADALCNLGVAYKRAGRMGDSLNCYLQALEADSNHLDSRANLGHLLFQMGRLEEAHAQFIEILKSPGDWLDVLLALAQIYWQGNELDAFIMVLDEVLLVLNLPRNRELEHLKDLIELTEEIRTTLDERQMEKEAVLASQVTKLIRDDIARAKEQVEMGS